MIFSTTNSYFIIILLLMVEFGFSVIMFAFMLTALFSKAKTAAAVGGITVMLVACFYYLQVKSSLKQYLTNTYSRSFLTQNHQYSG